MTSRGWKTPPDEQSGQAGMSHEGDDAVTHGGHNWMMIACCIPMIIIAIALVATGVVGAGFIVVAFGCLAMMWFMMRAMGDMGHNGR